MERLMHFVYNSTSLKNIKVSDVEQILLISRCNNLKQNITGILLWDNNNFFQVLEGPTSNVVPLITKIKQDARHQNVVQIINETIPRRLFENWSMGCANISDLNFLSFEGLNDFYQEGTSLTTLSPGRAKKLLLAFSKGDWHQKI